MRRLRNEVDEAHAWVNALRRQIDATGLGLDAPRAVEHDLVTPLRRPFKFAEIPRATRALHRCATTGLNVIDASFPYGDGMMLPASQRGKSPERGRGCRNGGAILHFFADALDWNLCLMCSLDDDEARHTQMGYARLTNWGSNRKTCRWARIFLTRQRGQDPIIRLGMLHYFETKNIGKKHERAAAFATYHDDVSQLIWNLTGRRDDSRPLRQQVANGAP